MRSGVSVAALLRWLLLQAPSLSSAQLLSAGDFPWQPADRGGWLPGRLVTRAFARGQGPHLLIQAIEWDV